ncbi:hypothetical protein SCUCBS95973_008217 [Sporothrix curviconia]|uniref:Xylose isomerase-like TIM barrel domain-containing protein n=1 Tax=Sporothrix curviconia TaxID=1260050 RepID=A0ABP0CJM7_9PEZI
MDCKLSISSMSLGRCWAGHDFEHKLDMARKYGYQGIEVFYEDLVDVAKRLSGQPSDAVPSSQSQISAASWMRDQCHSRGLAIISLQPFMHYDGLKDRSAHAKRLQEWELWLDMAHAMGTDLVLVPSSFLPKEQLLGSVEDRAADLAELADMAAAVSPPVRICYEALCWGTYTHTWEASWEVIKAANRPNLGLCLDSFNIAGNIYADPASPTGKTENADEVVASSMARLRAMVPRERVFLVQLVDAERLDRPLVAGHPFYDASQPARMSWSRNCRLFYGEEKAYLPVLQISKTIFGSLGYSNDWVSLELFNRRMSDTDPTVPEELARRGAQSWQRLQQDLVAPVAAPVTSKVPAVKLVNEAPLIVASL